MIADGERALRRLDRQSTRRGERQVVLADLVALGQVGVEVVLAVPARGVRRRRLDRQAGRQDMLHGAAVDDRQRARQAEADRADVAVRRRAVVGRRAGTEHLRLGPQLAVDLDADDGLVAVASGWRRRGSGGSGHQRKFRIGRAHAPCACESALLTTRAIVTTERESALTAAGAPWPIRPAIDRRNGTTLEQVASRAGVSRATVSRVVNGSPRVSPDVRRDRRGGDPAPRLRPQPRPRAAWSPAAATRSRVVITEPTPRLFKDPFFPRLLRGISADLSARDLQLVLLMPESRRMRRAAPATTWPPATSTARCWSASTATIPCPPASPPPASRWSPPAGRRRARPPATSTSTTVAAHGPRSRISSTAAGGSSRRSPGPRTWPPGIDRLGGYRDALAARRPRSRPAPRGHRRLHPGERRPGDGAAARRPPGHRRGLRRLRPHGRGGDLARWPPPAGASRRTSPSSASTTRPSPRPSDRHSPASVSRSRRWAARWLAS